MNKLWHMRLGHISDRGKQILSKADLLGGPKVTNLEFCEHCVSMKLYCNKIPKGIHGMKDTLDYIHSDCWGLSGVRSLGGHMYFAFSLMIFQE